MLPKMKAALEYTRSVPREATGDMAGQFSFPSELSLPLKVKGFQVLVSKYNTSRTLTWEDNSELIIGELIQLDMPTAKLCIDVSSGG